MLRAAKEFRRKIPNWAIGIAVGTPLVATLQGALMLQQYRRDHGHAPIPISPSQGLVVVGSSNKTNLRNDTARPLRLLVIGDSLAAGVGTSQSGTPILPQSIARALSGASHGRAVHWTCIGTPGASASQIIHDLGAYQDSPSLLERKYVEWQVTTRKAKEWWEQRKKLDEQEERKIKENVDKNRVQQWWFRVRRDVENLKASLHDAQKEAKIQTTLTRRKTLLDPDMTTQYDIAVVLTGINDLKDAFLPFMMRGKNASSTITDEQSSKSLKEALLRIVHALQDKMPMDLPKKDCQEEEPTIATSSTHCKAADSPQNPDKRQSPHDRGPLIVFPGLPASPLPLTQYPPLSWFLIPLLKMMDNNKRLLAQRFPGLVLYVDAPTPSELRNEEESCHGQVNAGEEVLLQLTNVTQRAQEKVKELMDQHYKSKSAAEDAAKESEQDRPLVYSQSCREHQLIETQHTPGSTLIAEDRIHPNDAGYDFWGRHIAAAIVREWNEDGNIK